MQALSKELRAWLSPGLAGVLATADASGQPEVARVFAYRVVDDADAIEVYLLRSGSEKMVQNLAAGARAAFNAIEVHSYRSRSFKGWCTVARDLVPADDTLVGQSLSAMGRSFAQVGMPHDALDQMLAHAGDEGRAWVCVLLRVDSVYDQSPKPGAGARL